MFDLENYLPYLVRRIVPRLDEAFANHLKAVDITIETWRVLITLYDRGPLSLSDLAELTSINLSTLSRMMDRMQARKLIRRVTRSEGSRRWAEIELLPLGVRKCEMLIPASNQLQTDIIAKFSADELKQMRKMLGKLYTVVENVAKARSDGTVGEPTNFRRPFAKTS
jgi:MarR family transcriptional regulator, organic hydroperoxide resistance regulator